MAVVVRQHLVDTVGEAKLIEIPAAIIAEEVGLVAADEAVSNAERVQFEVGENDVVERFGGYTDGIDLCSIRCRSLTPNLVPVIDDRLNVR